MDDTLFLKMINAQKKLNEALKYFLCSSLVNYKALLPFKRSKLNAKPVYDSLSGSSGLTDEVNTQNSDENVITLDEYACKLAYSYEKWGKLTDRYPGVDKKVIARSSEYDTWFSEGGDSVKYRAVHRLKRTIDKNNGGIYFKRAMIHGSVATLDDTAGFSDLDLAFIVRKNVLKDPKALMRLRGLAALILVNSYSFDPYMHHGPYFISEIDLDWYPEPFFPPVLFGYGVALTDENDDLPVTVHYTDAFTDGLLDMFERFFESRIGDNFILRNSYDIEWFLGSVLLLPALYLQGKTGQYRYKRDTFDAASRDFTAEEWEPVKAASEIRQQLGSRPHVPDIISVIAGYFKNPYIIKKLMSLHPSNASRAGYVTGVLGDDYTDKVLKLLRKMRHLIKTI